VSFDRPRPTENHRIDKPGRENSGRIDPTDPLPAVGMPAGRWAAPYQDHQTERWIVHLRHPESIVGKPGLLDTLTASCLSELRSLMAEQDAQAQRAQEAAPGDAADQPNAASAAPKDAS
jgi:hypothetical protein